jgi:hypothetical protein
LLTQQLESRMKSASDSTNFASNSDLFIVLRCAFGSRHA